MSANSILDTLRANLDEQILNLSKKGIPKEFIEEIEKKREGILDAISAHQEKILAGDIPFIIVIPRHSFIPLDDLIWSIAEINNEEIKAGVQTKDLGEIIWRNTEKKGEKIVDSGELYIMLGVSYLEFGKGYVLRSRKILQREDLFIASFSEGLSLLRNCSHIDFHLPLFFLNDCVFEGENMLYLCIEEKREGNDIKVWIDTVRKEIVERRAGIVLFCRERIPFSQIKNKEG